MIDVAGIAKNLEQWEPGFWRVKAPVGVSYPDNGHAFCHALEERSFWFVHRMRCVIAAMRLRPPGGLVLDVGGGNGYMSDALRREGIESVVVEPGLQGAKNAYSRGLRPVICSTFEGAGFARQAIPAICLFDVLEHVTDDVTFLRIARETLVPGGRLYITAPAYRWLWSVADQDAGHHRRYTLGSLTEKLVSAGFAVVFGSHFFCPLVLPTLLLRSLPSRIGLRKAGGMRRYEKELAPSATWIKTIINLTLEPELALFRKGIPVPFGGSCLVLAEANP